MIINPLHVNLRIDTEELEEEKITEIIQELIRRRPEVIAANELQLANLSSEIQKIIAEKGFKKISVKDVINNMVGYGILQDLLEDPEVTDVFVNGPDYIAYKKNGIVYRTNKKFKSKKQLREFIKRVVVLNGKWINENEAKVVVSDPRQTLRIVATLEVLTLDTPVLRIRKPPTSRTLDQLVELEVLTPQQANRLKDFVKKRKTIVIAGAPASGKTALLSALVREIPEIEQYKVIQESAEIPRVHDNSWVELIRQTENPNIKDYSLFELTKIGLLESLDRIIIGEIKGKEAYEWIMAVYSGMWGSMTTIHSNSAEEAIEKLIILMKMVDNDLSENFLRNVILHSVDYILYMEKFKLKQIYRVRKEANSCAEEVLDVLQTQG
ncbi:type II secretion system protein E [Caldicellulosiruptor kronotskyensis 2002]|uniref:Type II secretion system protein E n=1 Tax=Caldicellulosiruptor kronotskyensis (strain DSM 18902 / VKM B-2412 / 2002) TaxID=632348 RepID=E4SES2_CALK2|nr:ATPase, T2SS/T4P/T4SS family [Caldicellulosiruptor kronotskyensis]ADQ45559.1 type II secretion system protein E [Caldicellulosiruptor kronotskyensis 2002]